MCIRDRYEHTPVDAINHAMVRIRGSYALAIMFRDYPEEMCIRDRIQGVAVHVIKSLQ